MSTENSPMFLVISVILSAIVVFIAIVSVTTNVEVYKLKNKIEISRSAPTKCDVHFTSGEILGCVIKAQKDGMVVFMPCHHTGPGILIGAGYLSTSFHSCEDAKAPLE